MNIMKNEVTVISTIKNEKKGLEDFITSIFNQTLKPFEVIIVDGGSTDGSGEILKNLSTKYKSLKYYIEPGLNISEGRNYAIHKANTNIVASVDGGATLQKDWLEKLTAPIFKDPTIDVVSGFFIPQVSNSFEKYLAAVTVPVEEELQDEKFLPSSRSIAFKKKCWSEVKGYPTWLPICEDLIFDIKMKNKGYKFVVAPKALSSWRPRKNVSKFFIQYFKYARGDGHAKLFLRRHLIRYTTYATAFLLIYASFTQNVLWLVPLIFGGLVYTLKYYNRFFRHFPKQSFFVNLGSYFMIPFLILIGDVVKMIGYPVGVYQRIIGKIKFEEYQV